MSDSSDDLNPTTLKIQPNSHVTLHYKVTLTDGKTVFSTFAGHPATIPLGQNFLAPGIEAYLIGRSIDDEFTLNLDSDETFGPHIPELIQPVPRHLLQRLGDEDNQYLVGDVVEFNHEVKGRMMGTVVDNTPTDSVVIDFNHPMAGRPIIFSAKIIGILNDNPN